MPGNPCCCLCRCLWGAIPDSLDVTLPEIPGKIAAGTYEYTGPHSPDGEPVYSGSEIPEGGVCFKWKSGSIFKMSDDPVVYTFGWVIVGCDADNHMVVEVVSPLSSLVWFIEGQYVDDGSLGNWSDLDGLVVDDVTIEISP